MDQLAPEIIADFRDWIHRHVTNSIGQATGSKSGSKIGEPAFISVNRN